LLYGWKNKVNFVLLKFPDMGKNRLIFDPDYDFELYGIISSSKEYKLAWAINKQLEIHLVKQEDVHLNFLKEGSVTVSNYLFESGNSKYMLIRNKLYNQIDNKTAFLLPELQKFDFLLTKKGAIRDQSDIISKIKEIPLVNFVSRFLVNDIKSKENLIF
jgi:hypothetical protein